MPTILFAGTSPSVLGDILDTCEELRWMELHMVSPSPCIDMIVPLVTGFHTHSKPFGTMFAESEMYLKNWCLRC